MSGSYTEQPCERGKQMRTNGVLEWKVKGERHHDYGSQNADEWNQTQPENRCSNDRHCPAGGISRIEPAVEAGALHNQ